MTGNIDNVLAPKSMRNIVLEVMEYVEKHVSPDEHEEFKPYDDALHVIWPELFKSDSKAALLVSIAIYLDVADRKGFEIHPSELKELKL